MDSNKVRHCMSTTMHNVVSFLTSNTDKESTDASDSLKKYTLSLSSNSEPRPLNGIVNNPDSLKLRLL